MPYPGPAWEDTEDRKVLSGSGLRLIFTRAADRWTHTLELTEGGSGPLAWSFEADADRADPSTIASPAYQEIHAHDLGGGPGSPLCVLLTGRIFDHQFSAAVTLSHDTERPGGVVIDWDLADRCRAPVTHLAATYQMPFGSGDLADAGPHAVRWNGDPLGNGTLELSAGPPEGLALAEAGRNGTRAQAVAKLEAAGFTHRLRYRWRWSPGTDSAT